MESNSQTPTVVVEQDVATLLLTALTSSEIDHMDNRGVPELAEKLRPVARGSVEEIALTPEFVAVAQKLATICVNREVLHEQGLANSRSLRELRIRSASKWGLTSIVELLQPVMTADVPHKATTQFPLPSWGNT